MTPLAEVASPQPTNPHSSTISPIPPSDSLAISDHLSCISTSSPLPLSKMSPVSTYTWPSQPIPVTSSSSRSNVHDSSNSRNDNIHSNSIICNNKSQHTLHTASTTFFTASDLLNLDNTDLNPTSTSTSTRLIVTDMRYDGLWSLIVTVVDSALTDTCT